MTTADIKKAYSETISYLENRSSNPINCNPLDNRACDAKDLCGGLWYEEYYIPQKPAVSGTLLREAMGDRWETKHAFYCKHGCVRMIMFERAAILWWLVRWCKTDKIIFTHIVLEYVTNGQQGDADLLRSILAEYGCDFVADMLEDKFFNAQGIDWARNVINRYAQKQSIPKVADYEQEPQLTANETEILNRAVSKGFFKLENGQYTRTQKLNKTALTYFISKIDPLHKWERWESLLNESSLSQSFARVSSAECFGKLSDRAWKTPIDAITNNNEG